MSDSDIYNEILAFLSEYWARVDTISSANVSDFYTENGRMQLGSLVVEGRENIESFFENRNREQSQSGRVTRHFMANLRVVGRDADKVSVHSLLCIFAGSGVFPIASDVPSTIVDITQVLVRNERGQWRIESTGSTIVFASQQAALFVR